MAYIYKQNIFIVCFCETFPFYILYVQLITRIYELWTFSGVENYTEKRDFSV